MAEKATAKGGQAAARDISASPTGDMGAVGIIGNGASGNIFIHNLHVYLCSVRCEAQEKQQGK